MHVDELATYRERVALVLAGASDELVFNGSVSHARVVFEEAFKVASGSIRIVTSKLSQILDSGEVISASMAFLARPASTLSLLIEDIEPGKPIAGSSFIRAAQQIGGNRVKVGVVPADLVSKYPFNFMTVDDKAYRFEDDRSVPVAVVAGGWCANSTVSHLNSEFGKLEGVARAYSPLNPAAT